LLDCIYIIYNIHRIFLQSFRILLSNGLVIVALTV
jgi:hypothetical protein